MTFDFFLSTAFDHSSLHLTVSNDNISHRPHTIVFLRNTDWNADHRMCYYRSERFAFQLNIEDGKRAKNENYERKRPSSMVDQQAYEKKNEKHKMIEND